MDARSVQFQQQLQEKDDEINRLRRELRVRIQKRLYSSALWTDSCLLCTVGDSKIEICLTPQSMSLKHGKVHFMQLLLMYISQSMYLQI